MVDRGGCTCDILIENYITETGIFIEKYKNMPAAAPEKNVCGLAIDIQMLNDESVSNPIQCTNGVDRRQFSIVKNAALRFTSRIIQGNFTRGYCISIIRGADMCMPSIAIEKNGNGYEYLDSVVIRAMVGRGGCICDIFIDNYIAKTNIFIEKYENMSAAAPEYNLCGRAIDIEMLNDESVSNPIECTNGLDRRLFSIVKNDDNTLFIAIGIVVAVLVMTTIVIIYIISTRRRRSNKRLEELQRNNVPNTNAKNDDAHYDGLKDNILYVSATRHQDIDIHYSTVDSEGQQMTARRSEIDNQYNTVEINEGTMSLQTLKTFHDNETITNNETSKSSNQTIGQPNACSVVYAVVDKGLRNPIHSSSTKIQDDANPHQAYAIVDKTRNQDP
ncbi:Hypothetical predicted protein [Mytilus galloprovincialis]|uniref:Uncharacterized protein n=1 Tax=Mytilus galloprovincialis TaxID=29158 RepID=A0A8B6D6R4_MYTGA|nr:Hypothetical predicted protein [Mytilus galloprovincialis]